MSSFPPDYIRRRLTISGQVQGVGFRPFIYRIALENHLHGFVLNAPAGVVIEIQGPVAAILAFENDLVEQLPPLASIVTKDSEDLPPYPDQEERFVIQKSTHGQGHHVLISPDVATCDDCLADMSDPDNRRYGYPFTNCTNCGPRYTITRSIPYDRPYTSMACFPLCPDCEVEYEDPLDRRFHAQPNACPYCGPECWFVDTKTRKEMERGKRALPRLAEALGFGKICAVKGLGGFHLACDAGNHEAVLELRARKNRWDKPLAVMVPDLATAEKLAHISEAEMQLLTSRERPIVLLRARAPRILSPALAPDTDFIGIMLPYTPLHHQMFRLLADHPLSTEIPALVMTSGNMSSEPISLGNREAFKRLSSIADRFLFHNRDILIRTDDSVLRVNPRTQEPMFLRRARGYTPKPIFLEEDRTRGKNLPTVLGTGPELKATLCLTKGSQAFVSQHIGDMENLETLGFYREICSHLQDILQVAPRAVIHDLHPDYMTTRFAVEYAEEQSIPRFSLQHHFAHIHSVLAEHCHQGPAIGLALDGTGYGEDGTLWGGECLLVDTATLEHRRLARFSQAMLPGGEAAIREPWRIAQAMLRETGRDTPAEYWPWLKQYGQASAMLPVMMDKGLNCPLTSSCGRLFDAVSAMLGLCLSITYEGQAAIMLEHVQDMEETGAYGCPIRMGEDPAVLETIALFDQVVSDVEAGVEAPVISRRFHLGLVNGLTDLAQRLSFQYGVRDIPLSGGVMQNLTLATLLPEALREKGLNPLVHRELPPNDACISLGQAAWGRRRLLLDAS